MHGLNTLNTFKEAAHPKNRSEMLFSMHIESDDLSALQCDVSEALLSDDPLTATLATICDCVADCSTVKFAVSGFGQAIWPVSVRRDLAIVMEQIPVVLRSLRDAQETLVDFPEQGIQRRIHLRTRDQRVELECTSGTDWVPRPAIVEMSRNELMEVLGRVREDFLALVAKVAPDCLRQPAIAEWAS